MSYYIYSLPLPYARIYITSKIFINDIGLLTAWLVISSTFVCSIVSSPLCSLIPIKNFVFWVTLFGCFGVIAQCKRSTSSGLFAMFLTLIQVYIFYGFPYMLSFIYHDHIGPKHLKYAILFDLLYRKRKSRLYISKYFSKSILVHTIRSVCLPLYTVWSISLVWSAGKTDAISSAKIKFSNVYTYR